MKKSRANVILIVVGVFVLTAILGASFAAWFVATALDRETAGESTATATFDQVRQRFGDSTPILAVRDGEPILNRQVPAQRPQGPRLERMVVLAWDSEDEDLTRVTLPFWLLRLKSGPIEIMGNASTFSGSRLNITVEQLEQFGPALVVDHAGERGQRVLIWTE